ncbi:mandelate racemase/muconate lactonizing enzyme family protein [Alkalicoccobacillus porphyridii]|uniref:Mandelate racemase/muconate lactonizing enzyme family protein n=1 Tax=Alkalicoccobacillus porphyridii TaxID=2597270 RepID=A0A553ZV37_9BACI|nr:mandelate racemase/muconate lactonizing enzyme family protein [Alkalicoccobacillus porphyridii]TSB45283.1 mandelate racemase/muconate lactonizing enzyme family protein [Alkalicoccobacillus porphyridii]
MLITKIESFRMKDHPRELLVQIHTDKGIVGLGETNAKPAPAQEMIHTICADLLIGKDPLDIDHIWAKFYQTFNHHGCSGTEMRALSAINMALWDILGKTSNQPLYRLLGGASREKIKVYNTCVGYLSNDDRNRFINEPEKLAEELLNKGITAMKIWPYDELSEEYRGQYITPDLVKKGAEPFKRIRESFGSDMELILEGHGRWNLPSALRIADELEKYGLLWLEDITPVNNVETFQKLKQSTSIPIAASERLFTKYEYLNLLQHGDCDLLIADAAWTGGISEVKKIATLAELYNLPFAPHNCGGPVLNAVNAHICYNLPNLFMMETVRAFYETYYAEIVKEPIELNNGFITPPDRPGHGMELSDAFFERQDLIRQVSLEKNSDSEQKVYNTSGAGDPWKR